LKTAPSSSSFTPEHTTERRAGLRHILVVDDNNLAANSLARLLQIEGCEADARYCGVDAVRAVDELGLDAVILDIGMPRMNGYDACRAIRSKPKGQNMILIALTGWGQVSRGTIEPMRLPMCSI
jgi:CheY-like chemotaxis protein